MDFTRLIDPRPAAVLRIVGEGGTCTDAAKALGLNRKTVTRWRQNIEGLGEAYNRAVQLSRDPSPQAREELDMLVREWTPGGLLGRDKVTKEPAPAPPSTPVPPSAPELVPEPKPAPVPVPEPAPEPVPVAVQPPASVAVEPDILDSRGNALSVQEQGPPEPSPYTDVRPPTSEEWVAELAALALDKRQPAQVRAYAIAAVSSTLCGGPVRGRHAQLEDAVAASAGARGRDPGVPASVWREARKNFLGPAPDDDAENDQSGDVIDLERAPG